MQENQKKKELKTVPLEYLWEGLVLTDDVYNDAGVVLLIPSGEKITEQKLKRLANFAAGEKNITTYENSYRIIMEAQDAPREIKQKIFETNIGYTGIKQKVEFVLQLSQHVKKVESKEVSSVTAAIMEQLYDKELSGIFNCINVPRPMDEKLQRHCLNVAYLNGMMGKWLELPEEQLAQLVVTGLLHDIGKTKISQQILDAPRKLTEEEFEVVKQHPVFSYELLDDDFDEAVRQGVLHHHERMDGCGYPNGLKGEQIPFFAQITSITDVYDAMVSARSYKEARIPFDILERIAGEELVNADRTLAAVFVQNMIKHFKHKSVRMSDNARGEVLYIPPNDISHPLIMVKDDIRQMDEDWFCVNIDL